MALKFVTTKKLIPNMSNEYCGCQCALNFRLLWGPWVALTQRKTPWVLMKKVYFMHRFSLSAFVIITGLGCDTIKLNIFKILWYLSSYGYKQISLLCSLIILKDGLHQILLRELYSTVEVWQKKGYISFVCVTLLCLPFKATANVCQM